MIMGFVQDNSRYFDVATQNEYLSGYAKERNLKIFPEKDSILSQRIRSGDTVVISNISLLGSTLENIIRSIKQLAEHRIYIYSVKEDICIDTFNQQSLTKCMDVCLSAYKGIMSLRNSKIQQDLLEQGKPRGCPNNARKGKFILSGREEEVKKYVEAGLSYAKIAEKLGCTYGNVFYFVRYLGLKKIRAGGTRPVVRTNHKLDEFKNEIIELFNSGLPVSQIAKRFGVCYTTARDYLKMLGLRSVNGGANG